MNSRIKFIIDENLDFSVVLFLRRKGYNTTSIAEDFPSLDDINILRFAFEESRVILTNDKDFGELIFKLKLNSKGIILFRLSDQSSKAKIRVLEILLDKYAHKIENNFIVLSDSKVRF